MAKVEDLALSSRHRHRSADISDNDALLSANDQLGILYGMAENEAIGEVCSILEEVSSAGDVRYKALTVARCGCADAFRNENVFGS